MYVLYVHLLHISFHPALRACMHVCMYVEAGGADIAVRACVRVWVARRDETKRRRPSDCFALLFLRLLFCVERRREVLPLARERHGGSQRIGEGGGWVGRWGGWGEEWDGLGMDWGLGWAAGRWSSYRRGGTGGRK